MAHLTLFMLHAVMGSIPALRGSDYSNSTNSSSDRPASRMMARIQGRLDRSAGVNRYDGSSFSSGVNQDEMATLLQVLNKSGPLESPHHLPRRQRRKLRHRLGRNRYSPPKGSPFLGYRLSMGCQAFEIQFDGLGDIALCVLQCLALSDNREASG
jgi:hypothetical protein